jgi:hypothetical protein
MAREYTAEELGLPSKQKEFTPEELGLTSGKKEYTAAELGLPEAAPTQDTGVLSMMGRGVVRGAKQTGSLLADVIPAMAAKAVGADEYAAKQMEEAAQTQREIEQKYGARYKSLADVKGIGDYIPFALETVAEQIPGMATALIPGAGLGAVGGRMAAGAAAKKLAEREATEAGARYAAMKTAEGVGRGQIGGAFLGSYALNAPEVFQNIYEETGQMETGAALLAGSVSAALDSVLPVAVLKQLGPGAKAGVVEKILERSGMPSETARRVVGTTIGGAATEGLTEGAQEAISIAAEKFVQENPDIWGSKEFNRIVESSVRGAVGGGAFGLAGAGAGTYLDRRRERQLERGEAPPIRENAIEEASTYETTGTVPGANQPGVSVPTEEGETITGTTEPTGGDLGGAGRPPAGPTDREVVLDNQLNELRGQQAEIAKFDPTDPRIGEIDEIIKELQAERKAQVFTAPSQDSFEFTEPSGEPERRITPTAPTEFALTAPEGVVPEAAGIEAIPEGERARMMLIGEPTNPTKPLNAFFNNLKPDTANPAQSIAFRNEVNNLLDDVAEFVGARMKKEVKRFEAEGKGPDVSVPATGQELAERTQFLNNFFDSISVAPKERETLTSALSQRMAGMSAQDQAAALSSLTNVPKLNTLRGIREFRTKLSDALGKFERSRIKEEETALPYKLTDDLANMDPYVARAVASALRSVDRSTPEGAAAYAYFGPETGWRYSLAMRSAAFDLGAELNTYATAPFKGQNKEQAQLFKKWVEDNLPASELKRFDATVKAYERMNRRGEEFNKIRDELKKEGGVARKYITMITRAPTGKEASNLVPDAGMGKYKVRGEVTLLDPSKFYPMHPAIQDRIANNDLQGALQFMARDPGRQASNAMKFIARYAERLSELNLKSEIGINQQGNIGAHLIRANAGPQRRMLFQQLESFDWGPQFIKDAGLDGPINDPKTMRQTLNVLEGIKAGQIKFKEDVIAPVYGQFMDTLEAYKEAVGVLDSLGSYSPDLNFININADLGGMNPATFLHEVTHAATIYALEPNNYNKLTKEQKDAVDELKELHEFAVRKYDTLKKFMPLSKMDEYGFKNIQEFVAELMSNERFQNVLKKMKYKDGKTSMWDRFVRFVKQMFKLDNVAGYSMARVNDILMAPPALSKEAVVHNMGGRTKKRVSNGTMPSNPGYMSFLEKVFGGRPAWGSVRGAMVDFIENVDDTARKYYLGAFTLRQLNDLVGNRIPQFRYFINRVEAMLDDRNQRLEEVRKITDKWQKFQSNKPEQAKILNGVMLDATLQTKDPDKGPTGDTVIDGAWAKLDEEGKAIYRIVREYYKNNLQSYIDSIVENKKASLRTTADINSPQYKAETVALEQDPEVKKVREYFKKHSLEPYFPIRRFGRFSLQLRDKKDKEFYLFESAGERRAFMRKRIPELEKEIGRKLIKDEVITRNSIQKLTSEALQDFTFLKDLKEIVQTAKGSGTTELKNNIEESLEQLYFLTLPDQSIRKAFMNRKGTAGMNTDMLRAFTSSAFHMSYQQSRYKASRGLYDLLDSAIEDVDKRGGKEGTIDAEYLGELKQRLTYIMNPTDTGTIPSFLSNASFIWFMTSPASALVNMMGVPAVGGPVLSAKFGAANTVKKIAEYTKKFSSTGFKDVDGNIAFPSFSNKPGLFTPVQQRAFDQFVADGLIDITLSHDLVGMAEAPSNLYTSKSQTAMKWLSGMFHGAEKFNREIVSMSAFDMAYEKAIKPKSEGGQGYSPDAAFRKAIETAKDLTYKSMFDYSTLNKPRYFQQPAAKVILQFKQFSQQMTYLLARSTYEWIGKSYTPEELQDIRYQIKVDHDQNKPNLPPLTEAELDAAVDQYIKDVRTEARDRLGGTLGMTAVFAGATGLPLWWMVSGVMNAMHAVFGDEEEEFDFENWFRNWAERTFGGFVGGSISRGVASQVLGADVASRLSLNDLWYRDTRNSPDNVTALQNMFINLLGPTAGLTVNVAKGLDQFEDGHIQRAFETWSPALVKNILKGGRFLEEGRATTIRGNELLGDITGSEIAYQALGFTPERLAQRQKANIEMKTAEQNILSRRQTLLDAFFMAVDNSDDSMLERVLEKVTNFNQANPSMAILGDNLSKSVQTRYQQRGLADSLGGMAINKKLIGQLSEMSDYGKPE